MPGEVSVGSLQKCCFSSHLCTALEGHEAAVMFPKRPGFLFCFSVMQPWYSFGLQMGGGLSLA